MKASTPYEFQTVKESGVLDTRLILHSFLLWGEEKYFEWDDVRDFFLSAVPTARIEKNVILNEKSITIPRGTLRLLFYERMVLWNDQRIRINNSLIVHNGRFFIHQDVLQALGRKTGLFMIRPLTEPLVDIPDISDRDIDISEPVDKPEEPPPVVKTFTIGLLFRFSPLIPEQRQKTIQNNLKETIEEFFSPQGEIMIFSGDDHLKIAEEINQHDLRCFILLNFETASSSLSKAGRVFFITSKVHPLEIHRRRLLAGHEYSTNFKPYEAHNRSLAVALEEELGRLTPVRMLESGQAMIHLLQYLSLPGAIVEFYNLELEDDRDFFSSRENLISISRAMREAVVKFID